MLIVGFQNTLPDRWRNAGESLEEVASPDTSRSRAQYVLAGGWNAGALAVSATGRLRDVLPLIDIPVGDDAELDDVFSGYLRHYEAAWTCFDDAEETLEEISRLPVSRPAVSKHLRVLREAGIFADERRGAQVF